MGDIVEIDVQETKDGHLVYAIKSTVLRQKGKVKDYTLSELKNEFIRWFKKD